MHHRPLAALGWWTEYWGGFRCPPAPYNWPKPPYLGDLGRRGDTADTEGVPWGKGPRGEAAACRGRAQSHSRSSSASPGSAAAAESRTVTWQRPRSHVGQVTAVTCGRHHTMCPPVPPARPVPGSAQLSREHGSSPAGSPARGRARSRAPSSGRRPRSRRRRWGGSGAGERCPYMGRAAGPRAAAEVTVTSERREPSAGAGRGAPAGSSLKGGARGGWRRVDPTGGR